MLREHILRKSNPLISTGYMYIGKACSGVHNVVGDKDHSAYMSFDYFDAQLTPVGLNQVRISHFTL